ncbi:hypothetical protein BSK52_12930 [Paenibacillus odorifer]|uniref:Uncharacterized protein n=1 Tax=Paenibacillus odorifer TaxID=189426 RepID=A0A1R0Y092_9BACL|nr:hypothetical protein BSK52_12930 [Paenibacillus odorifer]
MYQKECLFSSLFRVFPAIASFFMKNEEMITLNSWYIFSFLFYNISITHKKIYDDFCNYHGTNTIMEHNIVSLQGGVT